jgi:hypothetical protein
MRTVLLLAALVLVLVGGGLLYGGTFTQNFIKDQLTAQKIKFPAESELKAQGRDDLVKYAAETVDTGPEAKAYASFIEGHLAKVANGQSYSEVSAAYLKDKTNTTLEAQRQQLFMGEMLRGTLLNVWGWSIVGTIATYSAIAAWVMAIALLAIFTLLIEPRKKTAKKTNKSNRRK